MLELVVFVASFFSIELTWHDKYVLDNCARCAQCCTYDGEGANPWTQKTEQP